MEDVVIRPREHVFVCVRFFAITLQRPNSRSTTGNNPTQTAQVNAGQKLFSSDREPSGWKILIRQFTTWLCVGISLSMCCAIAAIDPALDWSAWRGPTGDGLAASGQTVPVQWSETEGVLW